ncbi:MAG: PIN domain-containing protein [Acidobacteriaceae bacterium]
MSQLYLLDTDMASYVIKGRNPTLEAQFRELAPSSIAVSVITRAELMYGLKRLPQSHRLQVGVRQFLKIVRVLAWDAEAADFYAEIRHQLTTSGWPIGELDMMIAAHSLSAGAVLVSNNLRHYARINLPIVLENWIEN